MSERPVTDESGDAAEQDARSNKRSSPALRKSLSYAGDQVALEGIALFAILWIYSSKPRPMGAVSGAFLVGYGFFRFVAEFARQPDDFLGLLQFGLSMGQWLSAPMILAGVGMMVWAYRRTGSPAS